MIIECKNCQKKFKVNDKDIPEMGRQVQCSNCAVQWHQMPIGTSKTTNDSSINITSQLNEMIASDGKSYKYLGSQWAELLPSGKTGRLAKKKISKELNKFSETNKEKSINNTNQKEIDTNNEFLTKKSKGGMGIFSMLLILFLFVASLLLLLDTFKFWLIPIWPELDDYLVYAFETINNIYILGKDFFISYK